MTGLELRRRVMLSMREQGLPSAYQEVEYLESSGTQYLATNYTPNINSTFYYKFAFTGTFNQLNAIFGFYYGTDNRVFTYHGATGNWYAGCGMKEYNRRPKSISVNVIYESTLSSEHFTINETSFDPTRDYTRSVWKPISLFAIDAGTNKHPCLRLYRFTGYEQGKTACDFVPCYRKSDNVAGMYDLISRTFYTNAGTGEFIVGADV